VVLFEGVSFLKSKGHGSKNSGALVPGEERSRRGEADEAAWQASVGSGSLDRLQRLEVEERVASW
jgi:hypothetical protein